MRRILLGTLFLAAVFCTLPCQLCRSQTIITRDRTVDREYGDGIIARQNALRDPSPTITVVKNGIVRNSLDAWDGSVAEVKDGLVEGFFGRHNSRINATGGEVLGIWIQDNARATASGSRVGNVEVRGHGVAALKGSFISQYVHVFGYDTIATVSDGILNDGIEVGGFNTGEVGGKAFISGGTISGAKVRGDAELSVTGGVFDQDIKVAGGTLTFDGGHAQTITTSSGTTTINGGFVDFDIDGIFRGNIVINDVKCPGFLDLKNISIADLHGGSIDQVTLWDLSTLNMFGGNIVHDVVILNKAEFNRYGGRVGGSITQSLNGTYIDGDGLLSLYGYGLSSILLDPNYNNQYSLYGLSGFLSDNTNLAGELLFVENGGGATFNFIPQGGPPSPGSVPEPGPIPFLIGFAMIGAGSVAKWRSGRSREWRRQH